ncbi:MAG: DUF3108 domain-containing protein, partial [Candidatus Omnitrophica bacterium]|nr:DUF3108 domain-containing protein [Candidatus Omnitrophota bacterium]
VDGKSLCLAGVAHGQRYRFSLRDGLPAASGEALNRTVELTHYVRDLPGLELGRELGVSLPKKSFQITITSIEEIKVPAGEFRAYRFESSPKQIVIWVSADKRRLPLKIKGLGAVNYVMLLREFEGGTL